MLSAEFFEQFAAEWIAAWNSHDLDRVLAHYTDTFTMSSPYIVSLMNEPSGKLQGKAHVHAYWEQALALLPTLRFELLGVYAGAQSLTIHYRNQASNLAAEVLRFDDTGKVEEGIAH